MTLPYPLRVIATRSPLAPRLTKYARRGGTCPKPTSSDYGDHLGPFTPRSTGAIYDYLVCHSCNQMAHYPFNAVTHARSMR